MTIEEAIKFIIKQNDKETLTNPQRFKAYLIDLSHKYQRELKILNRALDEKLLNLIFGNERENVKIAKIKDELESQGFSEQWIDFIINSFGSSLNWKAIKTISGKENKGTNSNKINNKSTIEKTIKTEQIFEPSTIQTSSTTKYITISLDNNVLKQLFEIGIIKGNKKSIKVIDIPETFTYNRKNYKITSIGEFNFITIDYNKILDNLSLYSDTGQGFFKGTQYYNSLFSNFPSLEKVNLPQTVTEIGPCAFANCKSLKEINLQNIEKIGIGAFLNCRSLKKITIPKTVPVIEHLTFAESGLESIDLQDNIIKIDIGAFAHCKSLQKVNIPNIISIGAGAFNYCISLKKVQINHWTICPISNSILKKHNLSYSPRKIEMCAFANCSSLQKLDIPKDFKEIGKNAFKGVQEISFEGSATGSPWGAVNHIQEGTEMTISNQWLTFDEDEDNFVDKNKSKGFWESLGASLDNLFKK